MAAFVPLTSTSQGSLRQSNAQKIIADGMKGFLPKHHGYTKAYFHPTCWAGDGMKGLDKEVQDLNDFFGTELNFELVPTFKIPTTNQANMRLNSHLTNLVVDVAPKGNEKVLLVLFYGGHGLQNSEGQSIWSPTGVYEGDGVAINWSESQSNIMPQGVDMDVLLLLDCCYAAMAGRGHPPIREGLFASGMNNITPGPGDHSFTSKFLKTIRTQLKKNGKVDTLTLHQALTKKDAGLQQTPIIVKLGSSSSAANSTHVSLQKVQKPDSNHEPKPVTQMRLLVKSDRKVTPTAEGWAGLAAFVPEGTISIEVEDVQVDPLLNRSTASSLLDSSGDRGALNDDSVNTFVNRASASRPSAQAIYWIFRGITGIVRLRSLVGTVKSRLDPTMFERKTCSTKYRYFGTSLRHAATSLYGITQNTKSTSRYAHCLYKDRSVVMDFQRRLDSERPEKYEARIRGIAKALKKISSGQTDVRVLECIGYTEQGGRLALVYSMPSDVTNDSITLTTAHRERISVSLDDRLNLSRSILHTVAKLNDLGYSHPGISPDDVVFFREVGTAETAESYRLGSPWIFGFRSRHTDGIFSQVIGRIGAKTIGVLRPYHGCSEGLTSPAEEMNAMGRLLLFIGLVGSEKGHSRLFRTPPTDTSLLGSCMGVSYQKAVERCLEKTEETPRTLKERYEEIDNLLRTRVLP